MSKETSQFLPTKINNVIIIMIGETLQFDIVHFGVQQFIQHFDNLCKHRSFIGILWPAIVHYVVELSATMLWFLQAISIPHLNAIVFGINYRSINADELTYLPHNISCRYAGIWRGSQCHNLPHKYAEAPDIWLYREYVIIQRLCSHPSWINIKKVVSGQICKWIRLVN